MALGAELGDAKTCGLNLEDTRITDPRKLSPLMSLVALALGWSGRTAADLLGNHVPPRKRNGYYARSWFRTGFDHIRNRLRSDPSSAIASWRRITPKPVKSAGVVMDWMPPPDGIAMCQAGEAYIAREGESIHERG